VTDAHESSDEAVAAWRDVSAALAPIIGLGGVAALYNRSVSLCLAQYPWLISVSPSATPADFVGLGRLLSQQDSSAGVAANEALLRCVSQLLCNLIGTSLTERLLHPVWEKHGAL
jgi:hypothetical protein